LGRKDRTGTRVVYLRLGDRARGIRGSMSQDYFNDQDEALDAVGLRE